jgi:hypothetical protein
MHGLAARVADGHLEFARITLAEAADLDHA